MVTVVAVIAIAVVVGTVVVVTAFSWVDRSSDSTGVATADSALDSIRGSSPETHHVGVDVWEVAVCRIPAAHDVDLYDMTGVRLERSAQWVVDQLAPVSDYFERWSSGRYHVEFRAADEDVRPIFGGSSECIEQAIAHSAPDTDGVLVVADAQHRESRGGGWGRGGEHCPQSCAARDSRRAVYLGAADFVAGSVVPVDLVEHELGHALGWPHSRHLDEYDSPVDVMSDSAAARRLDPLRLHAPGVLALNRYLAGWMKYDPIVVDARDQHQVTIDEKVFAFVAVSATRAITVEVVDAAGDNAHLDESGVVVHLVDWGSEVCSEPQAIDEVPGRFCGGSSRSHRLITTSDSRTSTREELLRAGILAVADRVEIAGVVIVIDAIERLEGGLSAAIRIVAD